MLFVGYQVSCMRRSRVVASYFSQQSDFPHSLVLQVSTHPLLFSSFLYQHLPCILFYQLSQPPCTWRLILLWIHDLHLTLRRLSPPERYLEPASMYRKFDSDFCLRYSSFQSGTGICFFYLRALVIPFGRRSILNVQMI